MQASVATMQEKAPVPQASEKQYRFYVVNDGVSTPAPCKSSLDKAAADPSKLFIRGVKHGELISVEELSTWEPGHEGLNRKARVSISDALLTLDLFQVSIPGMENIRKLVQK